MVKGAKQTAWAKATLLCFMAVPGLEGRPFHKWQQHGDDGIKPSIKLHRGLQTGYPQPRRELGLSFKYFPENSFACPL